MFAQVGVAADRAGGGGGVDDQRAVQPHRFLHPGMAMIPIGARLPHRHIIGEGFAGADTGKADAGHAIHLKRHQQPMPVDRRILAQPVGHRDPHALPFAQPDQRCGDRAVDRHRVDSAPIDHGMMLRDGQRDRLAAQGGRGGNAMIAALRPCRGDAGQQRAGRERSEQRPAVDRGARGGHIASYAGRRAIPHAISSSAESARRAR